MEFLAGRGSSFNLRGWAGRLRDAGLALARGDPDRFACVESYWSAAWPGQHVNQDRYDTGRLSWEDSLYCRYYSVEADVALQREWARLPKKETGVPPSGQTYVDAGTLLDSKPLARAQFTALHADPGEQARLKLRLARQEYPGREKNCWEGHGASSLTGEAALRVLGSELALETGVTERTAARQRYWTRLQRVYELQKNRYERGLLPLQDYMENVYMLRDADIMLLRTRASR
jgi:hypothetical protein